MQIRYLFLSVMFISLSMQLQAHAAPSWSEATQLFAQHNYSAAASELAKLDEKTPGNASIHFMLGKCYQNLGQIQQAKKQFEWVAKNAPNGQTRQLAQDSLEGLGDGALATGHSSGSSGASTGNHASSYLGTPPNGIVGGSPSATVAQAAKVGWVPCSYGCLNFGTPGWHKQHMDGYPDSDWWMDYKFQGGTQYFSQYHVGHLIQQFPDRAAQDAGSCPNCHGTGWVKR